LNTKNGIIPILSVGRTAIIVRSETTGEIEERQNLREGFRSDLEDDIESLNDTQLGCLERLRDFIADGLVQVRVRNPENGYFHAKGAAFRAPANDENGFRPDDQDTCSCATFVVL
jgi:hypothetical protein